MPKSRAETGGTALTPSPARKSRKKIKPETPADRLKMEIARELGLAEKVEEVGWGGLTAAETGRIGGILTKRLKEENLSPIRS